MDPIRSLDEPLLDTWGLAAELRLGSIAKGFVGALGGIVTLGLLEAERERRRASEARARADREALELEERARAEAAAALEAQRRDQRRRTGRASTILASSPLGVATPIAFALSTRRTLG